MLMLSRMAVHLSYKVVALHFDNRTARDYYVFKVVWYHFSFQTSLPHFESEQKVCHYSYSSLHTYTSHCGSNLSIMGKLGQEWHLPHIVQVVFQFGISQRWNLWHPHVPFNVNIITAWKSTSSWNLGVECFQPYVDILGEFMCFLLQWFS